MAINTTASYKMVKCQGTAYTNLKMDHIIKDNSKIINFKEGVN
jgi:hypothetical protein